MKTYATNELGLIAALALSFHYIDIDDTNPKRIYFIFEETPELLAMVDDYFNDQLMVSALAYNSKLKLIKTRLYQTSANGFLYK